MITVADLSVSINKKQILTDIDFQIPEQSITQIFGPNGAGKTTLFRVISGIYPNYSGSVQIENRDLKSLSVKDLAKTLTFLPQFHHFSLPVSVKDILMSGRYPYTAFFRSYTKQDRNRLLETAEEFKILDILNRDAMTLSGGEIKKVMLASAFIQNVPIILLDEPFVSLDPESAIRLKELLLNLNRMGKTIIVISHRMELMYPIATHMIAIQEGRINYSGKKANDPALFRQTLGIDFQIQVQNQREFIFINE